MLNKTMLESLKLANGNRRERTLTIEQIEKEISEKVEQLLEEDGMLKKNLSKLIISNSCSVAKSYKYRTSYTHYDAELNSQGKIKSIKFSESFCVSEPYGGYSINACIKINIIDYSEEQIKEALRQQIFKGR